MGRILGLDLGTNSIGWAVVERNIVGSNGDREEMINLPEDTEDAKYKGVVIFPEGVKDEKGNKISRAAERTSYRSARKLKFRRKLRKYETLKVLHKYGLCPIDKEELETWRSSVDPETGSKRTFKDYPSSQRFLNWLQTDDNTGINPYYFRDKLSRQKYDWQNDKSLAYQLGRAFYHMAQRRGFASNRQEDDGDDKVELLRNALQDELDKVDDHISFEEFASKLNEIVTLHLDNLQSNQSDETKKVKRITNNVTKTLQNKQNDVWSAKEHIENILKQKQNLGQVQQGIQELTEEIHNANCQTLGQYFYTLYKKDRNNPDNKIRTRYTSREEHYKHEFDLICNVQEIPEELKEELKKAIFYQRPLKSQKGTVGRCTFETSKPRCPVSHPAYEEYRMWSFINNIKIQTPEDENLRSLTDNEKYTVLPKFYRVSKPHFPFREIADALLPDGNYAYYKHPDAKQKGYKINYKPDTTVSGCPVTAGLMSIFGKRWEDKADWRTKLYQSWHNKTYKNGVQRTEQDVVDEFWHALYQAEMIGDQRDIIGKSKQDKLREFAERNTNLDQEEIESFSRIKGVKKDYANLSLRAIRNILPWLREEGLIYSHAVLMANMHKVVDSDLWHDEQTRNRIREGINEIIDNHNEEIKKVNVVNAQISEMKEHGGFSEKALAIHQKEIEERLAKTFGHQTWAEKSNKQDILEEAWQDFEKQARKKDGKIEHLKKERIDDAVKRFLLGDNEDGEVFCNHQDKLKYLYHPSDIDIYQPVYLRENGQKIMRNGQPLKGLGSPRISSIKNPVVMRTLHQVRKLVNQLLKEGIIDHKTKVHIEMARELNDANKRAAIERYQREREALRNAYREKIKELYKNETGTEIQPTEEDVMKFSFWMEQDPENKPPSIISENDIEKYKYWDEQHHRCVYTGETISITDFIGPNPKYDIEHTIPRSVSYDNSQANKTLCNSDFNRNKKGEKMPSQLDNHEDILQRIEPWKQKYLDLENRIEDLVKRTKSASTKEQKDSLIQERHYLAMHRDYWKDKYERFTMTEIPSGFKNSQKVDTGTITKYARLFLGSVFKNRHDFPNVFAVNGSMVDEFRKAWGLHDKEVDENGEQILNNHGLPVYKEKDRSNHVHHCIDAITVASMTPEKYDQMAYAWGLEDKGELPNARKEMENSKPWATFTEDVRQIENEVLVVHQYKDNVPKQTKKKLRKRGKIQYKDAQKQQPIYQQGDTARGSLHQETFYGKIKEKNTDKTSYVVRKYVKDLKENEIDKIVDPKIREIIIHASQEEKKLKKELNELKKKQKTAAKDELNTIQSEIQSIQDRLNNDLYVIPPRKGKTVYTPIRKVRIKAHVSETLPYFKRHKDIKTNQDGEAKHPHKNWYYVKNDENYCLALYESDNEQRRAVECINLLEASEYFRLSNKDHKNEHSLVDSELNGLRFRGLVKPGNLVLFYEHNPGEIWELDSMDLVSRLYLVKKINKDGRATFQFHQEARNDDEIKKDFRASKGEEPPKSLINGYSSIDFNNLPQPRFLLSPNKMNILLENQDFELSSSGQIYRL